MACAVALLLVMHQALHHWLVHVFVHMSAPVLQQFVQLEHPQGACFAHQPGHSQLSVHDTPGQSADAASAALGCPPGCRH